MNAVVPAGVGIQLVVNRHHPAVPVVEDVEAVACASIPRSPRRQGSSYGYRRIPGPARAGPGCVTRSGRAMATCTATNAPRLEPIRTARSSGMRVEDSQNLIDHPGDRERREVRLVEVRRLEPDAGFLQELLSEEGRLGRPGRRGEAVQIQDEHRSRCQGNAFKAWWRNQACSGTGWSRPRQWNSRR